MIATAFASGGVEGRLAREWRVGEGAGRARPARHNVRCVGTLLPGMYSNFGILV